MWKVADRLLFEYAPGSSGLSIARKQSEGQLLQWNEAAQMAAERVVIRALESGQLVIAQQLHERLAHIMSDHERSETAILRSYAGLLHRNGYTMIAAEMFIQCMAEGELDAEGFFWLGETLYAKGHLDQALSLFEQALEQNRISVKPVSEQPFVTCRLRLI